MTAEVLLRAVRSVDELEELDDARGFYDRMGYRGKHAGRTKELPLPGRVRDLRAAKLLRDLGDVDAGIVITLAPLPARTPT